MGRPAEVNNPDYCGRILQGKYSTRLISRLRKSISALEYFDETGSLIVPYISAWCQDDRIIWYEFVSQRFCEIMQCAPCDLSEVLRRAIIDSRIYRYTDIEHKVEEKIITRDELRGSWKGLREAVIKSGEVDAVYKVAISDDQALWLKDQASIETFDEDNICISIGFLTDVTKEMELKDLFEKIGYIDELTRLPRRSILDRILEINIGNIQRGLIKDFVLMMIDVDNFKKVNDTYGHQAGDYVLATLADAMTATTRKQDEIGRYGGEEFYGFTVGDLALGVKFAERLRRRVEKTKFVYEKQRIPVTISIGLASAVQQGNTEELSADRIIFSADKRLYAAKHNGRNVVVSED